MTPATRALTGGMFARGVREIAMMPANIPMLLLVVIMNLWAWVNAPALFGESAGNFERAFVVYMVMTALLFLIGLANHHQIRHPLMDVSVLQFVAVFSVLFGLAVVLLFNVPWAPQGFMPSPVRSSVVLWFTVFVVAATEESVFRGVLPDLLVNFRVSPIMAHVLSAFVFAIFHWYAYRGSVGAVMFAFVAGLVFSLAKWLADNFVSGGRHGISVAIALHSAFNARVLGLLSITGITPIPLLGGF